jgi:hypothetical protein
MLMCQASTWADTAENDQVRHFLAHAQSCRRVEAVAYHPVDVHPRVRALRRCLSILLRRASDDRIVTTLELLAMMQDNGVQLVRQGRRVSC